MEEYGIGYIKVFSQNIFFVCLDICIESFIDIVYVFGCDIANLMSDSTSELIFGYCIYLFEKITFFDVFDMHDVFGIDVSPLSNDIAIDICRACGHVDTRLTVFFSNFCWDDKSFVTMKCQSFWSDEGGIFDDRVFIFGFVEDSEFAV